MSVPENEKRRPLGTDGAQENGHQTASTPSLNPPNIAGIDGPGEGEGLVPATAAAMAFLMEWCENGPWVLTSIVPDGKTTTATFDHKSVDEMRDWIDWRQGKQNIYFTVNVVFGSVKVKPNKGAISAIHAFHVDVDPRVGEDPAKEKERAARLLREYRPAPTVIIDSGGGMQGFWLLGSKVAVGGSADLSRLYWRAGNPDERGPLSEGEQAEVVAHDARVFDLGESRNLKIETDLQADHCHSIDHIMRLPGTVNLPTKKKRAKGRKPALARVVEADWTRRYRLDDFTPAPRNLAPAGAPVAGGGRVVLPSDLPAVLVADLPVSDHTKMLIVQGIDPDNPNEDRSKVVWRVACQMVRDGCTDSQIAAVILDDDNKISWHVLDQPRSRQYAARQIARARVEAIDPELAELNARHVVIETMGPSGKCRIMERLPTPDGRGYVAFQSFEDFGNRYDHRRKLVGKNREGKDTEMPLGKWWKNNPNRRQHKTMVFLPGGADVLDGDALNLWNGFAVRPAPGSWALMQQHIRDVLADGDAASAEYITKWAAYAVQHPGSPAEAALVFRGDLGTGKGAFGKAMMKLFGQHGVRTQGAAVLDSRFNVHLRDCVLLFADEVDWDSRRSSSQIKGMVTEPSLFIEPKGVDATNQPNYLHIIIASNNDWVIPAAPGERRFAAFRVSDRRMGDKAYFNALFAEMDAGGLAAMLHDLLAMDLSGWHPRFSIPQTRELSDQKLAGLSGADAIVREMLMGGVAPGVEQAAHDAEKVLLVRPLIRWALDNRIVATDPGERRMAEAIKRMGIERRKLTLRGGGQKWVWPLPPLAEARASWAAKLGLQMAWPDEGEWATFPG